MGTCACYNLGFSTVATQCTSFTAPGTECYKSTGQSCNTADDHKLVTRTQTVQYSTQKWTQPCCNTSTRLQCYNVGFTLFRKDLSGFRQWRLAVLQVCYKLECAELQGFARAHPTCYNSVQG